MISVSRAGGSDFVPFSRSARIRPARPPARPYSAARSGRSSRSSRSPGPAAPFLEAEPDFARLLSVDVYGAGAAGLESNERAIQSTQRFIEVGLRDAELDNPIAAESIQSTLYAMLSARVQARKRLLKMAPTAC